MHPRPTAPAGASSDRSARFWARAYPRRWRAERGDELIAVLADLAGPAAHRVDARTAADLVRSGWATRLRSRPPVAHWLAYRLLGAHIRPEYRAWARDDIEGSWFPLRRAVVSQAFLLVFAGLDLASPGPGPWSPRWWFVVGVIALVGVVATARTERARALERHLTLEPGEGVVPGALVRTLVPRRRVAAASALAWAAGVLAVCAVTTTTAVLVAPHGWSAVAEVVPGGVGIEPASVPLGSGRAAVLRVFAAAVTVGLLVAALGAHRVRRVLPRAPAQPHRTTAPVSGGARLGLLIPVGLVLVGAANEAMGAMALWLSPVVGTPAWAVLPPTIWLLLLARRVARRGQPPVAVDVVRAALTGRVPEVDEPVLEPRPVVGPVPPGAVVRHPSRPDPPYPPVQPVAYPPVQPHRP